MTCPVCGTWNPEGASRCLRCHHPLPIAEALPTRSAGTSTRPRWRGHPPALIGTVIAVEPLQMEPPDLSALHLLAKPVLALFVPLVALWALLSLANPLFLLLFALCLVFLLRVVRLGNLLPLFFLARMRRVEELLPVQYFRVRDERGHEHVVRRKGHLVSGHVMPGDEVALWGHWRHGVLYMQRGLNLRTHTHLVPRSRSFMAFLVSTSLDRLFARRGGGP